MHTSPSTSKKIKTALLCCVLVFLFAPLHGQQIITHYPYLHPYTYYRQTIFVDGKDVWYPTFGSGAEYGAAQFEGAGWKHYNNNNGLSLDSVAQIAKDGQGNILLMGNNGINRLKNNVWEFFPLPYSNSYDRLLKRIGNDVWMSYGSTDLYRISDQDTIIYMHEYASIYGIEKGPNNIYYTISNNGTIQRLNSDGIWKYDTTMTYYGYNNRKDFHIDKYNTLWKAAAYGLFSRKENGRKFESVTNPFLDTGTNIFSITSDQYGVLYLGTGMGLIIKNNDTWSLILEGTTVFDVEVDDKRNIWAVTKDDITLISNSDPADNINL